MENMADNLGQNQQEPEYVDEHEPEYIHEMEDEYVGESAHFNYDEVYTPESTSITTEFIENPKLMMNNIKDIIPEQQANVADDMVDDIIPQAEGDVVSDNINSAELPAQDIIHEEEADVAVAVTELSVGEEKVDVVVDVVVDDVVDVAIENINSAELPVEDPVAVAVTDTIEENITTVVEPSVESVAASASATIPKIVFIVPYRDREQQYEFFSKHMKMVLEDYAEGETKIYYIHQKDNRQFNRGAMKNIGFLMVKDKYPDDYKNITLVFNDIDIMPLTKNFFKYETDFGVVKHFYGFVFALGGIVSIKAGDFENISGFPNFWAWGYEDNLLQHRVTKNNLQIDRSSFYPIMDKNILILPSGITRVVNKNEFDRYVHSTPEGFQSINGLQYSVNEDTGFVDVSSFNTSSAPTPTNDVDYDLRNGAKPFGNTQKPNKRRPTMKMMF